MLGYYSYDAFTIGFPEYNFLSHLLCWDMILSLGNLVGNEQSLRTEELAETTTVKVIRRKQSKAKEKKRKAITIENVIDQGS
jgi:hypothetical protein